MNKKDEWWNVENLKKAQDIILNKQELEDDDNKNDFGSYRIALESEDFKAKFGHYDWNDRFLSSARDINTEGGDIPVMWVVITPYADMDNRPHLGEDEINSIANSMNKPGGTVDPERTGYELAVSSTIRKRVKGSSPKKRLHVIYLKKV